jgi:hypothetical protein
MPHKQPGLDKRHRDNDGEIHKKRGDTLLRTLRNEYGNDLLKGTRSDTRLDTILEREGVDDLNQLLRKEGFKR